MNKKPNCAAINEYNQSKKENCKQRVLDAIDSCVKENNITTTAVCEKAGIHRSYFSNNPEMRQVLDNAKKVVNRKLKKTKQNTDSRVSLEKALRAQIAIQEKRIKELESQEKYKDLYTEKCIECEKLKVQLDNAVKNSGLLNF